MKKDLKVNSIFKFADLSPETQEEFLIQFIDDYEFNLDAYQFKFVYLSFEELTVQLDQIFGYNLIDVLESNYIFELANDIEENGLRNPPIGNEGIHRRLAFYYLNRNMPYFQVIYND